MTELSDDDLREYAADIILDHAKDIERSSIYEMAEGRVVNDGEELSNADANKVRRFINMATVRVSWPDHEYVYGDGWEDETETGETGDRG